jgi:hypothetical protein
MVFNDHELPPKKNKFFMVKVALIILCLLFGYLSLWFLMYGPFMTYYFIDSLPKREVTMKIVTMMLTVDMVWFFPFFNDLMDQ